MIAFHQKRVCLFTMFRNAPSMWRKFSMFACDFPCSVGSCLTDLQSFPIKCTQPLPYECTCVTRNNDCLSFKMSAAWRHTVCVFVKKFFRCMISTSVLLRFLWADMQDFSIYFVCNLQQIIEMWICMSSRLGETFFQQLVPHIVPTVSEFMDSE